MRVAALLLVTVLAAGSAGAQSKPVSTDRSAECPKTTNYLAEQIGSYRGKRVEPRKLTEAPSGTAYMAVYRQIGGCEAPLTMVDYRRTKSR